MFKVSGVKVLFKGQRCSKGHHECMLCGRPIGPGEYYWVKVVLYKEPHSYIRHLTIEKYCCKRL